MDGDNKEWPDRLDALWSLSKLIVLPDIQRNFRFFSLLHQRLNVSYCIPATPFKSVDTVPLHHFELLASAMWYRHAWTDEEFSAMLQTSNWNCLPSKGFAKFMKHLSVQLEKEESVFMSPKELYTFISNEKKLKSEQYDLFESEVAMAADCLMADYEEVRLVFFSAYIMNVGMETSRK